MDELNFWLAHNSDNGGVVTLTNDIWVNGGDKELYANVKVPVSILAGSHTIYLNGGGLELAGPVTLEGDTAGAPPLIDDIAGSGIYISGATVAARERDAIRCFVDADSWDMLGYTDIDISRADISASGDGVTALRIDNNLTDLDGLTPVELDWDRFTASGGGSAAIRSSLPLSVNLCAVTAEGDGAAAIDAPGMDVSCSKVEPLPGSCVIAGFAADDEDNFLEVPAGIPPWLISLPDVYNCYCGQLELTFDAQWDTPDMDTSVPGTYCISGTADGAPLYIDSFQASLYSEIGPQTPDPVFTLQVSKPRKPEFTDEMYFDPYANLLYLSLKDPVDPDAVTLYMWNGGMGRWVDITHESGLAFGSDFFNIPNIYDGNEYGFKVAAGGYGLAQGNSDPFWVKITDDIPTPDTGGDRTGTDRGGDDPGGGSGGTGTGGQTGGSGTGGQQNGDGTETGQDGTSAADNDDNGGPDTDTGSMTQTDAGNGVQAELAQADNDGVVSGDSQPDGDNAASGDNTGVSQPGNGGSTANSGKSGGNQPESVAAFSNVNQNNGGAGQSGVSGNSDNIDQPDQTGESEGGKTGGNLTASAASPDDNTPPSGGSDGQAVAGDGTPNLDGAPYVTALNQTAPAPGFNTGLAIVISLGAAVLLGGGFCLAKVLLARR
ncbi:MAG: hypothetical protein FWF44_01960 [Defluviitaleaceae bacterium]|nr:hypothetical protein [Defluviitaleaceae bacterium]